MISVLTTPKYEVVGEPERVDQTDTIMARRNLVPDSEAWMEYYQRRPELEAEGRKWVNLQKDQARRTAIPPQDALMASAMYSTIHAMSEDGVIDGETASKAVPIDPARASEKIRGVARELGADIVGIGPLNQAWTYSHTMSTDHSGRMSWTAVDLRHRNAIVVATHYRQEDIYCAPHFRVGLATLGIYIRLSAMVVTLARYIRSLGYSARAHTPFSTQVLDVPLAIDAGLGELARNGIVINREYGSNFKPMSVTTDLPLEHDSPVDIGVDEFCSRCTICARVCPSGAIPRGSKRVVNGVLKWKLSARACYEYWLYTGGNCSLCISCCPWTRPRTFPHNMIAKAVQRSRLARRVAVQADTLFCREKKREIPSWLERYPEVWRDVLKPNHPFYRPDQSSQGTGMQD